MSINYELNPSTSTPPDTSPFSRTSFGIDSDGFVDYSSRDEAQTVGRPKSKTQNRTPPISPTLKPLSERTDSAAKQVHFESIPERSGSRAGYHRDRPFYPTISVSKSVTYSDPLELPGTPDSHYEIDPRQLGRPETRKGKRPSISATRKSPILAIDPKLEVIKLQPVVRRRASFDDENGSPTTPEKSPRERCKFLVRKDRGGAETLSPPRSPYTPPLAFARTHTGSSTESESPPSGDKSSKLAFTEGTLVFKLDTADQNEPDAELKGYRVYKSAMTPPFVSVSAKEVVITPISLDGTQEAAVEPKQKNLIQHSSESAKKTEDAGKRLLLIKRLYAIGCIILLGVEIGVLASNVSGTVKSSVVGGGSFILAVITLCFFAKVCPKRQVVVIPNESPISIQELPERGLYTISEANEKPERRKGQTFTHLLDTVSFEKIEKDAELANSVPQIIITGADENKAIR